MADSEMAALKVREFGSPRRPSRLDQYDRVRVSISADAIARVAGDLHCLVSALSTGCWYAKTREQSFQILRSRSSSHESSRDPTGNPTR